MKNDSSENIPLLMLLAPSVLTICVLIFLISHFYLHFSLSSLPEYAYTILIIVFLSALPIGICGVRENKILGIINIIIGGIATLLFAIVCIKFVYAMYMLVHMIDS